jgi:hypothetical protein
MSRNYFYRDPGVELLEIHDYHDDFPYLTLPDIVYFVTNESFHQRMYLI